LQELDPDRAPAGGSNSVSNKEDLRALFRDVSSPGLGAVEHLDFATICNFAKVNHRIRAPLARTPALSVNLAMSDQLSRSWCELGSVDIGPNSSLPKPLI